jgi:hypothetical protein
MIRIRGPDQCGRIDDPDIRNVVEQRFAEICQRRALRPRDPRRDDRRRARRHAGVPGGGDRRSHRGNPFDDSRFPHPEFVPVCEYLEKSTRVAEMTFVLTDDGAGTSFHAQAIGHRSRLARAVRALRRAGIRSGPALIL